MSYSYKHSWSRSNRTLTLFCLDKWRVKVRIKVILRFTKKIGACAENLIFGRFSTFEIFKNFWSEILSLTMGILNKNCSEKTSAAHYTIQKHRGGFCSSVFWRYNFTKSKNGGMESGKIQSMYQIWFKIGSKCFKNNKKINLWIQNAQHFHLRRQ